MKTLFLSPLLMTCIACSARPSERYDSSDGPMTVDGGLVDEGTEQIDAASSAPAMLEERLEFDLRTKIPVEIAPLGLKVTLLEAFQTVSRRPGGRWSHGDRLLIRFERVGEAPLDVRFGSGQRVHALFGHEFAVWGGTQLSVYPPGMPADP